MKPIPPKAKIGVVIGTYGSVPYVGLSTIALEEYATGYNEFRDILIHDDGSPDFEKLNHCVSSDFMQVTHYSTGKRVGAPGKSMLGDMSAFVVGLKWAAANDIDLLVKLSRRFIINRPFVAALQELAHNTQYATYSGTDMSCGLGFRSECCALHVPSWIESGAVDLMKATIATGEQPVNGLVGGAEGWYHERAREVHRWAHPDKDARADLLAYSEGHFTRSETWSGYGYWPMLGLSRTQKLPGILWHNSCSLADYAALAQEFGLPYTEADFVIPSGAS
jgi:hypothetical protein